MEVFLECCMTLFFSAAMLLLIVRLAKGEEKNMMFARVFSLASNVGFWIGIVRHRCAEPERISDVLLHHRRNAFLHGDGICHAA